MTTAATTRRYTLHGAALHAYSHRLSSELRASCPVEHETSSALHLLLLLLLLLLLPAWPCTAAYGSSSAPPGRPCCNTCDPFGQAPAAAVQHSARIMQAVSCTTALGFKAQPSASPTAWQDVTCFTFQQVWCDSTPGLCFYRISRRVVTACIALFDMSAKQTHHFEALHH
jgi:hypothetical protein